MTREFTFHIDIKHEGVVIASVFVKAIAYLYRWDGTLRTVDINNAYFSGCQNADVAGYVSAAQPDTWDEWLKKAQQYYLILHPEDTTPNESA